MNGTFYNVHRHNFLSLWLDWYLLSGLPLVELPWRVKQESLPQTTSESWCVCWKQGRNQTPLTRKPFNYHTNKSDFDGGFFLWQSEFTWFRAAKINKMTESNWLVRFIGSKVRELSTYGLHNTKQEKKLANLEYYEKKRYKRTTLFSLNEPRPSPAWYYWCV